MVFSDRAQAGRRLARRLRDWTGRDVIVLGLARGGVPVAEIVARRLGAPLEVLVARKLSVSARPELALGAIGEMGVRLLNEDVIAQTRTASLEVDLAERAASEELARRVELYRGARAHPDLRARTAIVIDDGVATGATARVACRVARAWGAEHVVLAAPVAPVDVLEEVAADADELVVLETPSTFNAVGEFYRDFTQTSDEEVLDCLRRARTATGTPPTT